MKSINQIGPSDYIISRETFDIETLREVVLNHEDLDLSIYFGDPTGPYVVALHEIVSLPEFGILSPRFIIGSDYPIMRHWKSGPESLAYHLTRCASDPTIAGIGFWMDKEDKALKIEVIETFADKDQALRIAQRFGQKEIWDRSAGATIRV